MVSDVAGIGRGTGFILEEAEMGIVADGGTDIFIYRMDGNACKLSKD